jgi:uncharacterized protein
VTVFVDTSAMYALIDADDLSHSRVLAGGSKLGDADLVTHSFVMSEVVALVRRRLGSAGVLRLIDDVLARVEIVDVDAGLRTRALAVYRENAGSRISFVDRTSFEFMRRRGITRAWAVDADFEDEGFELV